MMKKMIMALCIFICVFTLVACSGVFGKIKVEQKSSKM